MVVGGALMTDGQFLLGAALVSLIAASLLLALIAGGSK